jgi:hypothetical protein
LEAEIPLGGEVTIGRKAQQVCDAVVKLVNCNVDQAVVDVDGVETTWYVGSTVIDRKFVFDRVRWTSKTGNVAILRRIA